MRQAVDQNAPGTELMPPREPSSAVAALRSLWESKRGAREMPDRGDFQVVELARWLGRLNLMSLRDDTARFDVYGTSNSRELGLEMTGLTLEALPHSVREVTVAGIARVRRERGPVFETVRLKMQSRMRTYDRLLLPLAGADGEVEKILVLIDSPREDSVAQRRWSAHPTPLVHAPAH